MLIVFLLIPITHWDQLALNWHTRVRFISWFICRVLFWFGVFFSQQIPIRRANAAAQTDKTKHTSEAWRNSEHFLILWLSPLRHQSRCAPLLLFTKLSWFFFGQFELINSYCCLPDKCVSKDSVPLKITTKHSEYISELKIMYEKIINES